jgi:hypothetical protein
MTASLLCIFCCHFEWDTCLPKHKGKRMIDMIVCETQHRSFHFAQYLQDIVHFSISFTVRD